MKAVVWQAPGQIDPQDVPDARIEQPGDAVVRVTMSAICGTDLHMVWGTMPDMVPRDRGLQSTFARVPFAAANLIPLSDAVSDEQAIVLSDIYPTAWFGVQCAEVSRSETQWRCSTAAR